MENRKLQSPGREEKVLPAFKEISGRGENCSQMITLERCLGFPTECSHSKTLHFQINLGLRGGVLLPDCILKCISLLTLATFQPLLP